MFIYVQVDPIGSVTKRTYITSGYETKYCNSTCIIRLGTRLSCYSAVAEIIYRSLAVGQK